MPKKRAKARGRGSYLLSRTVYGLVQDHYAIQAFDLVEDNPSTGIITATYNGRSKMVGADFWCAADRGVNDRDSHNKAAILPSLQGTTRLLNSSKDTSSAFGLSFSIL